MLKLGLLLIGPAAFRKRWYVLTIVGFLVLLLGMLSVLRYIPGIEQAVILLLGLAFAVYGLARTAMIIANGQMITAPAKLGYTLLAATFGTMIFLFAPVYGARTLALMFAVLFLLDGLNRVIPAWLSRFPAWRELVVFSAMEFLLAIMLVLNWPFEADQNITVSLALYLVLTGWLLLKTGLLLRNHEEEAALLLLPIFGKRGWYDHAPVLLDHDPQKEIRDTPLTVYVWTPAGSANIKSRRPIVDRYLAAADPEGNLSFGHVALGSPPDIYISHYPEAESAHSAGNFVAAISGRPEHHVPGIFKPSYAEEVANWRNADERVTIHNVSTRRLRAFWAGYKQDSTYNLVNRNCSTLVAAALDASVEGALSTPFPWLRLMRLLLTPDFWQAALVRSRAEAATWTPGLVLDYASPLARLLDRSHR